MQTDCFTDDKCTQCLYWAHHTVYNLSLVMWFNLFLFLFSDFAVKWLYYQERDGDIRLVFGGYSSLAVFLKDICQASRNRDAVEKQPAEKQPMHTMKKDWGRSTELA